MNHKNEGEETANKKERTKEEGKERKRESDGGSGRRGKVVGYMEEGRKR